MSTIIKLFRVPGALVARRVQPESEWLPTVSFHCGDTDEEETPCPACGDIECPETCYECGVRCTRNHAEGLLESGHCLRCLWIKGPEDES